MLQNKKKKTAAKNLDLKNKAAAKRTANLNSKKGSSKYEFEEITMVDVTPSGYANLPTPSTPQQPTNPETPTSKNDKIKVFVNTFLKDKQYLSYVLEIDDQISVEKLLPTLFKKIQDDGITENWRIKSFLVLNKQTNEYITVTEKYLLQPFDKFEIYLAKREESKKSNSFITVQQCETENEELSSLDTSNVKTMKELIEIMSEKMDFNKKDTVLQKYDNDFETFVPVEADEKFDSTKSYKFQLTKTVKFDVCVAPEKSVKEMEKVPKEFVSSDSHKKMEKENKNVLLTKATSNPQMAKNGDILSTPNSLTEIKNLSLQKSPSATVTSDNMEEKSNESVEDPVEVVEVAEILHDQLHEILDKLTTTNSREITIEIFEKSFPNAIKEVVDLIFEKAVTEPSLIQACAYICMGLHSIEENREREKFRRLFHSVIIRKIQGIFESDLMQYPKTEIDNIITFISTLFKFDVITFKIIENCVVILIRNAENSKSELMVELAIKFLKLSAPFVYQKDKNVQKFNVYKNYMDNLLPKVSYEMQLKIMDLFEVCERERIKILLIRNEEQRAAAAQAGPSSSSSKNNGENVIVL